MNIRITSYAESTEAIRRIRDTVFGLEQKVPRELDWDGNDTGCIHVLALDDSGDPIGTGRLQSDGKIGRLAVLPAWRGKSVGNKMIEALVDSAREQDLRQVYLHAQVHARPFYEKSGFREEGDEFMEASIRHTKMTRDIHPG